MSGKEMVLTLVVAFAVLTGGVLALEHAVGDDMALDQSTDVVEEQILFGPLEGLLFVGFPLAVVLFYAGALPIPVGYERGKIKFLAWCGTGMHAHIVYWTDDGLQTLHPADRGESA